MSNKYKLHNTSDSLVGELLFKVKDSNGVKPISFITRCLSQGSIEPLRFVSRYLVNNINDPSLCKELLDKYLVAIVYFTLMEKNPKLLEGLRSSYLDSLYENGITIDRLNENIDDASLFSELIKNKSIVSINKEIFEIIQKNLVNLNIASSSNIKIMDRLKKIIYYKLDFFNNSTEFEFFKDSKRSNDLLIAEARSHNKKREFSFNIPLDDSNYDEFLKNVLDSEKINGTAKEKKDASRNIKDAALIIAHLVNDSISSNKSLNITHTITSSELKGYELDYDGNLTRGKVIGEPVIKFLVKDDDGYYYPDLSRINSFKVIYNNELYLISKNGIEKI